MYSASSIFVGSGEKRATFANENFTYDADHALIVTSPLPMLCQTTASAKTPVLTMVVSIDMALLRDLLVSAELSRHGQPVLARTVSRLPLSGELEDTAARLLRHLANPQRASVLAGPTIRELLFLVLDSPHGGALRAAAESSSRHLAHVLRHINAAPHARTANAERRCVRQVGRARRWLRE